MAKEDKQKRGPRELDRAGALCLAFANLSAVGRDDRRRDRRVLLSEPLATYAQLVSWAERMGALPPEAAHLLCRAAAELPAEAATVVATATALSAALWRLFTALALGAGHRESDVALLNQVLCKRQVIPEADGFRRGWPVGGDALDRMLWPLAESAADLLASDRLHKVGQCAAEGCSKLFVYANSRRRWCDENSCGNRAKGKRYHDMVRRAKKDAQSMTYFEINEKREQSMASLAKEQEEIDRKNERLRQTLREIRARKAAASPAVDAVGSDGES